MFFSLGIGYFLEIGDVSSIVVENTSFVCNPWQHEWFSSYYVSWFYSNRAGV